jgi:hypothetical protein
MGAISWHEAHGFAGNGASWDTPPPARADPGQVLADLDNLDAAGADLERHQRAALAVYVLDQAAADLYGWGLANRPDPTAPLPVSQAEQRRRDLADAELIRSWRD